MLVELDAELLAPGTGAKPHPDDDLVVLAICALGLDGRHRVVALERDRWREWAESFPPQLADALQLVWDHGEHAETVAQSAISVRVRPERVCSYLGSSLALDPPTALALLGRPLRVLLENGRNDRRFLLAFARGDQRTRLEKAERQGWIAFETAGGISELKARAEAVDVALRGLSQDLRASGRDGDKEACLELLRMMMISDSDTRAPDEPSAEARAIARCLAKLEHRFSGAKFYPAGEVGALERMRGRFGTVLKKRAAENYAPPFRRSEVGQRGARLGSERVDQAGEEQSGCGDRGPGLRWSASPSGSCSAGARGTGPAASGRDLHEARSWRRGVSGYAG